MALGTVLAGVGIVAVAPRTGDVIDEVCVEMSGGSVGPSSGEGVGGVSDGVPTSLVTGVVLLELPC